MSLPPVFAPEFGWRPAYDCSVGRDTARVLGMQPSQLQAVSQLRTFSLRVALKGLFGVDLVGFQLRDFEGTMQSTRNLQGGFVVIVAYLAPAGPAFVPEKHNRWSLIVHDLPDLPAGKRVKVKFNDGLFGKASS